MRDWTTPAVVVVVLGIVALMWFAWEMHEALHRLQGGINN